MKIHINIDLDLMFYLLKNGSGGKIKQNKNDKDIQSFNPKSRKVGKCC